MGRSLVPITAATDDWAAFEAGLHVVPGGKA
jgi:hypothetical protein